MTKKKVLFIGIGFYDYEDAIIEEFKNQNYEVDYFSETPINNFLFRMYSRFKNLKRIESIKEKHSAKILEKANKKYDLVFIIKGESFSAGAIKTLKDKNPNAEFILYLWDSICRIKDVNHKLQFFNKVYSFDRLDCVKDSSLIFNPLFFRKEYINTGNENLPKNDIYHLGWYHSDRLVLIKKIAKFCEHHKLKYQFVLFTGYFSYFTQSLYGGELKGNKKYLVFKPVSAETNFKNILNSKITLDIAHPSQSGLTMRTIELVGAQRKIITTNTDIVNYDFYNSNNILVIDRDNPDLKKSFFESEFKPIPYEISSKYSIENWLKKMIE
nr:hypothetical protein [uncultured Flavobacterium sp.]